MLLEEIYKVNLYIDDNVSIGNNNDGDNKILLVLMLDGVNNAIGGDIQS